MQKSSLGKAMLTSLTQMATKYHFTMSYSSFISFSFPFPPHPFPTCPFPCTDCATAILQLKPLCFCGFLSSCQLTQLSAFLASFRPWHPKQQPRQPSRTPLQLMGQIWAMKCLVCGEGSKTFPSRTSLKKHLLRSHPISATDLKGTYVAQMTVPVPNLPLTLRGQGALDIHVRFERKGRRLFNFLCFQIHNNFVKDIHKNVMKLKQLD